MRSLYLSEFGYLCQMKRPSTYYPYAIKLFRSHTPSNLMIFFDILRLCVLQLNINFIGLCVVYRLQFHSTLRDYHTFKSITPSISSDFLYFTKSSISLEVVQFITTAISSDFMYFNLFKFHRTLCNFVQSITPYISSDFV